MNQPPAEHEKLLQQIDDLISQAQDETTRRELVALRARLSSPEMRDLARDPSLRRTPGAELVLEFHDPQLPMLVTASGSVISATICLYAVFTGLESPMAYFLGRPVNLWIAAAVAGAFSVMFTALSFARAFSVRIDTKGMISRSNGPRWRRLRVGAMAWKNIRSLGEREDGVLEVRAATGEIFGIPMRVGNYPILKQHLENMVRLYGDRG